MAATETAEAAPLEAMLFSISLFALTLGCEPDLAKDRAVAEVQAPAPEAPAPAPAPEAAADPFVVPALTAPKLLAVDTSKSSLEAIGAKISAQHPIKFHDFAGNVGIDGENVTGVAFVAKIGTLESDAERLTEHLKGEDFLWAEKYPVATFVSKEITAGGEKDFTHTVAGDLTIRGKTVSVKFPATLKVTPTEATANTEFVINRKDFDVVYPGKPDDLVQDSVVLKVSFTAPRT